MSIYWNEKTDSPNGGRIVWHAAVTLGLLGLLLSWACPQYRVWQQRLEGEAELAKATYSRQVLVQEAQAKKDAAALLGEAEVARAHGLAEANHIVGASLGGPENYLRYLWIQQIDKVSGQVIYVPTETGLPLTEAGKRP